ncbi:MAG: hypothetical protein ACR2P8_02195 [Myxococcota bacterium]
MSGVLERSLMFCKVCNTRLGANDRHCPNCGQDAPAEAAFARTSPPKPLPSAELSTARDEIDEDILELNEVSGEEPPPRKKAKAPEKKAAKSAKKAAASKAGARTGQAWVAPDAAGLRTMLADMPQSLEPGLKVYRNSAGKAVGAGYVSGVGDIDLLATDKSGDLVVVMISEKGQGEELIGEVLQRVGWVRKHVGDGKKQVRGIVLCQEPPESLSYAAAAVADTIAFKTYRIALTFEDLEI